MSGISRATALEIFTQPDDLEFSIGCKDDKWAIMVTRGPGHNFKLLITTEPVFESKDAAIKVVEELLDGICQGYESELTDPSSLAAQFVNPEDRSLENANVLTAERREWIIQELKANDTAGTYKQAQAS